MKNPHSRLRSFPLARRASALAISLVALVASLANPALSLAESRGEVLVYVSESGDRRIATYALDTEAETLRRVGELELEGAPGPLEFSPDRRHLYAAVRSERAFATLSVDPATGALAILNTVEAAGSAPYLFAEPTGRWLLASYYGEGLVSVSPLGDDGVLAGPPATVVETGRKAHCIRTDPQNRFAFVPHTGELNKVEQLRFDAESGALAPNDPSELPGGEGQGPRHLKFHPNGRWVYLVNEQGKSVTLCDYDAEQGTLVIRQTLSTHPEDWDPEKGSCAEVQLSADGRFLYASNRGHDSLAVFGISPDTGELSFLERAPTEQTPRSFHLLPPDEAFVVAAGQGSNRLALFRRDAESGRLTRVATVECGESPAWVTAIALPAKP